MSDLGLTQKHPDQPAQRDNTPYEEKMKVLQAKHEASKLKDLEMIGQPIRDDRGPGFHDPIPGRPKELDDADGPFAIDLAVAPDKTAFISLTTGSMIDPQKIIRLTINTANVLWFEERNGKTVLIFDRDMSLPVHESLEQIHSMLRPRR